VTDGDIDRAHHLTLFDGGPFVRSLRLVRLRRDEIREVFVRRALVLMAVTWLPLLLLAALDGQAFGDRTQVPFLLDAGAWVRFLIGLPLLVLAEIGVQDRVRQTVAHFAQRELVAAQALPRFGAAVASATRMRDSWLAEAAMLLVIYALAIAQFAGVVPTISDLVPGISTWHTLPADRGGGPSAAGLWFMFVSVPLVQFITLRWFYRIFIWGCLMWRVSRLELRLIPTHPDRVAGLGFLSQSIYPFLPLALALGTMMAAVITNQIFHAGASLADFKLEIVGMVLFVFGLVLVPLLFFGPALMEASLKGMREYGAFAEGVVRSFDQRWLRDGSRRDGELLEVGEVSAMTDLDTTLAIIQEMHFVPITRDGLLWLAAAVLAPVAPLVLTVMPAEELLKSLAGMLF